MPVVEAWLLGGPADGRLMPVEVSAGGEAPPRLDLPQTGVYVGSSDLPAPTVVYRYVLSEWDEDVVIYRYRGPVKTPGQ